MRQIANFLFKFGPEFVKRIEIVLCFLHFGVRCEQPGSVTGNRRVLQLCAFGLQKLFGLDNALLDTGDPTGRSIANAFKPAMASSQFRCAGATTDQEYSRFIADDAGILFK